MATRQLIPSDLSGLGVNRAEVTEWIKLAFEMEPCLAWAMLYWKRVLGPVPRNMKVSSFSVHNIM